MDYRVITNEEEILHALVLEQKKTNELLTKLAHLVQAVQTTPVPAPAPKGKKV